MRRIFAMALLGWALSGWAVAQNASPAAPYAGQDRRGAKALAPSEIEDLLAGRGMGLAKVAELNSYPGPAHALDLADALDLSAAQRAALAGIKARMSERAMELGRSVIALEADLDRAFADGTIDAPTLDARLVEIARVQASLRAVHLHAHLQTRAVLSPQQIAAYNHQRGYASAQNPAVDSPHPSQTGGHPGGHKH